MTETIQTTTLFENRPEPAVVAYPQGRKGDRQSSPEALVRRRAI